jgi:NAD(P)-dependent dehydrogenase (short-subunit alcohol dehydrogenase family)
MDAPLDGQHAVVTGAGRGIGAAIADELGRLGASLTLMGRTRESLERRRTILQETHDRAVEIAAVDVTSAEQVERAFAAATAALGPPTILVNNAGAARSAPFARTDPALWREMLEVNLTGPFLCARQVVPTMIERGHGRLVNVASTAGLTGYPYVSAYCAAKHGLIGLSRALAIETARTGVTVNAVCPGFADTDLTAAAVANIVAKTGRTEQEARAELTRRNPQGRLIDPAEVARAVGWLCLPGSAAITGQSIVVAGGEVM